MFEHLYDQLMNDVDYDALYQQIKTYLNPDDMILDAGCGSGYFLVELMKHQHHVIGIDISSAMLSLAQNHLVEEGLHAPLFEHDLRQPLSLKVDVVLMMFDVVNYFKGVKQVFKHVKHSLNPMGKFIFDVYKEDVLMTYDGYLEKESIPIDYEWTIHTKDRVMIHRVTAFNQTDQIIQYVYPLEYYLDILNHLGFNVLTYPSIDSRKHLVVATLR